MAAKNADSARLAEITERAAKIAALVPEHLQVAAFNRAFDELSGGGGDHDDGRRKLSSSGASPRPRKPARRSATPVSEQNDVDSDPASVLIASLSRTDHPEINDASKALDRALYLLRIAGADHGIDGLTAPAIARVLTEKFRWRVTHQSIRQALDQASNLVDRVPQKKGGAIYRLMQPGENYLDAGGAAGQGQAAKAGPASARRPARRRSKSKPKAQAKPKPKAKTKPGSSGNSDSTARKRVGRGPKPLVEELIAEGFFSEPRVIGDIQERLSHKKGVRLKATDLSPALVRLLRQNQLDRERNESNQYEYRVPA